MSYIRPGEQRMLDALEQHGPLDNRELAKLLGISRKTLSGYLCFSKDANPKRIYIYDWTREAYAGQAYLRPVWALGNRRNAPRPPVISARESDQRRRENQRNLVNSVFALGGRIHDRRSLSSGRNNILKEAMRAQNQQSEARLPG
jgi:hypothetical protein